MWCTFQTHFGMGMRRFQKVVVTTLSCRSCSARVALMSLVSDTSVVNQTRSSKKLKLTCKNSCLWFVHHHHNVFIKDNNAVLWIHTNYGRHEVLTFTCIRPAKNLLTKNKFAALGCACTRHEFVMKNYIIPSKSSNRMCSVNRCSWKFCTI